LLCAASCEQASPTGTTPGRTDGVLAFVLRAYNGICAFLRLLVTACWGVSFRTRPDLLFLCVRKLSGVPQSRSCLTTTATSSNSYCTSHLSSFASLLPPHIPHFLIRKKNTQRTTDDTTITKAPTGSEKQQAITCGKKGRTAFRMLHTFRSYWESITTM
jgi:hypothetical protein